MKKFFYKDNYVIDCNIINKYFLLVLVVSIFNMIFTYGCVSSHGNKNVTNKSLISQIKKGVSRKEDVKSLIGSPQNVSFIGNDEHWYYYYTKTKVRSTNCIPVIGSIFGGIDTQSSSIIIIFDNHGIVKKIGSANSSGGGGGIQDNFK